MEGLGEKFQKARIARNLTLDEAARMTKIRPSKLQEIEAEDFSHFPSLAYAKGFLLIYGKFLNVDVTPYLEAFETSDQVTVDGYSYLQDNPAPKPRRVEVVPRRAATDGKSSLLPFVIGVVVLIAGFSLLRLIMDLRRIKAPAEPQSFAQTSAPSPTAAISGSIVALRALPADSTPAPTPPRMAVATPAAMPSQIPQPTPVAIASAQPAPTEAELEVRRAEPVRADDLAKAKANAPSPSPGTSPAVANRFEVRPLKKTFVRIVVDSDKGRASFERWIDVSAAPVQLSGKKIAVKVLNPADVEIRKNGKLVARGDSDVRLE